MATGHLKGAARFRWTPPGGSEVTHLLAAPLSPVREIRPARWRSRYDWWAEDGVHREVVVVGEGVEEVTATIRMDDEPEELLDMLQAALEDDLTLTYQLSAGGAEFPVRVVEVLDSQGGDVGLVGDRGRYGGGEWEVRVRIRRTDGGSLAGMFS